LIAKNVKTVHLSAIHDYTNETTSRGVIMDLGERLKIARQKAELSQQDAADLVNISNSQLSRYETNKSDPAAKVVTALAKLYGVSADYLLGLGKRYSTRNNVFIINETTEQYFDRFGRLTEEDKKLANRIVSVLLDHASQKK